MVKSLVSKQKLALRFNSASFKDLERLHQAAGDDFQTGILLRDGDYTTAFGVLYPLGLFGANNALCN